MCVCVCVCVCVYVFCYFFQVKKQKYQISTKTNRVYDITEKKVSLFSLKDLLKKYIGENYKQY